MTTPVETRRISDLKICYYIDTINDQRLLCEPTPKDICDAIKAGRLEKRNYQRDLAALTAEWEGASENSLNPLSTWQRLVTDYHAARIAHFVVSGWDDPISINANDEVTDGTHRIKAAIFKGDSEVEVITQP